MVWVVSLLATELIPRSLTPVLKIDGIRSLHGFGRLVGPLVQAVLYHRNSRTRLVLKLFRGEPAISRFDWPFTPTHSSSHPFSTEMSSDLHALLHALHPGHG
jgi:hypothetical protein